jgi:lipoyl(octanoyl) transferase
MNISKKLKLKSLGIKPYTEVWKAMRVFTDARTPDTPDEIWIVEHPPVYTQGQAGKAEHIINPGDIPVVQSDRGGQVTYHGPGQLVVYCLIDLKRKQIGIRDLVTALEQAVIDMLSTLKINAHARPDAPGIYIDDTKICSIGLRVRKGCSYHGLAFNVTMDLSPFEQINPCGFNELTMSQLSDYCSIETVDQAAELLIPHLLYHLGYNGPVLG